MDYKVKLIYNVPPFLLVCAIDVVSLLAQCTKCYVTWRNNRKYVSWRHV